MNESVAALESAGTDCHGEALLEVKNLEVEYVTRSGPFKAVEGVGFTLHRGESVGIVGESGSGKSTTARAVLGLQPQALGEVLFFGEDILQMSRRRLRRQRVDMQMIFQDPMASLNPRLTVRQLVAEGLKIWPERVSARGLAGDVDQVISNVGLDPDEVGARRAGELSGGQCQRVAIARAIALQPELLVCDEAVSALDVSVQAQVLNLLRRLRAEFGLTLMFISHDLGVVKNISDRIVVMYMGRVCEVGGSDQIFSDAKHPYTRILLDSVPGATKSDHSPDVVVEPGEGTERATVGCRFRARCPLATARCAEEDPELRLFDSGQQVACHNVSD